MLRAAVALVVMVAPCSSLAAVDDLAAARDHAAVINTRMASPAASPVGPIQAAAHRAVTHIVANATDASSDASHAATRGWIARHPILFGALAGATVGTAVAAAAWGGEGAFVGLYGGAAAGAVVGTVLR